MKLCVELVLGQRGDLTGAAAGGVIDFMPNGCPAEVRPVHRGTASGPGRHGGGWHTRRSSRLHRYGIHAGVAFALRDGCSVWGDPAVPASPRAMIY
jgi:hypothetical protein